MTSIDWSTIVPPCRSLDGGEPCVLGAAAWVLPLGMEKERAASPELPRNSDPEVQWIGEAGVNAPVW